MCPGTYIGPPNTYYRHMTSKRASSVRTSPVRAVGYVRLSRASDESTSISRQRKAIDDLCAGRGWVLVDIVEDVDISATKRGLDRPGLDRVRQIVATGGADVMAVWRIDRAARSIRDLSQLADELDAHNAALVSATEPFDMTTAAGRMLLQLLGVFAEFEAAVIRERVISSRAALAAAGRNGGKPAFGYATAPNPDGPGRVLVIEPTEAAALRRAARAILEEDGTLHSAVRALNADAVPTRGGGTWRPETLKPMLCNLAAAGCLIAQGEPVRDDHGYPIEAWPPVLTMSQVHALRARLIGPARTPVKRATRLLSGLARCASCGGNMVAGAGGADGAKPRFVCRANLPGRPGCPHPASAGALALESYVEAEFLARVGHLPRVRITVTASEPEALARVEEAIKATGAALVAAVGSDPAEAAALTERLAALKGERDALASAPSETMATYENLGHTFGEAWERAADAPDPIAARRALLGDCIEKIVVAPGVRGRRGFDPERAAIRWVEFLPDGNSR